MAEVVTETHYARHNRHKLVLVLSAMRHFREVLRAAGFEVLYFEYEQGLHCVTEAVRIASKQADTKRIRCCEPGEYRLRSLLEDFAREACLQLRLVPDDRFLISSEEFSDWARGRKQPRMEYFYRHMRRKHKLLLDPEGKPEGGQWNFDAQNRRGWRGQCDIPERPRPQPDAMTLEVIAQVNSAFPDCPGDLGQFYLGVTEADAEVDFSWFLRHGLPLFGTYQDALAESSPWMFHSVISMYLNIGLLHPLDVCQRVEQSWRDGACPLPAAEGFIRQVLGWREYVRGIYWLHMPQYAEFNALAAERPLPGWFWSGDTDLLCLQRAIQQSLSLGYAHHIQRLMVIGNFALLAGLDVRAVCHWYLSVYVDAFEWVELPNTLGMALYADNGVMASKPYAASGKYIQRQGDHCKGCRYSPRQTTGSGACPLNSLYWHFLDRHSDRFDENPRMALAMTNWRRKDPAEAAAIVSWAESELARLAPSSS